MAEITPGVQQPVQPVAKKNYKKVWQSVSLIGMLAAPVLFLYPGAKGNTGLEVFGYLVLVICMVIPLVLKK